MQLLTTSLNSLSSSNNQLGTSPNSGLSNLKSIKLIEKDRFEKTLPIKDASNIQSTSYRSGNEKSDFVTIMSGLTMLGVLAILGYQDNKQKKQAEQKQQTSFNKLNQQNTAILDSLSTISSTLEATTQTPSTTKQRTGVDFASVFGGYISAEIVPKAWGIIEKRWFADTVDAEALRTLRAAQAAFNLAEGHVSNPTEMKRYCTEAIQKFEPAIVALKSSSPDMAVMAKATQLKAYISHGGYTETDIKNVAQQVKNLISELYVSDPLYRKIINNYKYSDQKIEAFSVKEYHPLKSKKDNYFSDSNGFNLIQANMPSADFKEKFSLNGKYISQYKPTNYLYSAPNGVFYEEWSRNDSSVQGIVNNILNPAHSVPSRIVFRVASQENDWLQSTIGRVSDINFGIQLEKLFDVKLAFMVGDGLRSQDARKLDEALVKNDSIVYANDTKFKRMPDGWGYGQFRE
jgi:hypothetical protein